MYYKTLKQTPSKVFVCAQANCNKAFTTKFSLQRHQSIHTGYKPFECQYCGKKFSLSQSMREHIYSHTKERPYICGINDCKHSFRHLSELSMHRRMHPEYKPRKYHYLCTSDDVLEKKNIPRKFAVITTRIGSGKTMKMETDNKEPSDLLSHETGEDLGKENYGLDIKFLSYLANLSHAEGKIERPKLPFPEALNSTTIRKE